MSLWVAPANSSRGVVDMPYAISNVRCENGPASAHVRIGWYRSVFNIPHAFAVCSFADEMAAVAGRDPLEYLRELIGPPRKIDLKARGVDYPNYGSPIELYPIDTGRLRGTLDLAAENAGWGSRCHRVMAAASPSTAASLRMSRRWSRSPSLMTDMFRFHASIWPSIAASP
jgi:CO/xanthine dehydrogenase Mo-binding subunit